MVDYHSIHPFVGKKGPASYKAAKTNKGHRADVVSPKAKKAQKDNVAKKIKRVSNKIVRYHSQNAGPASHNRY